MANKNDFVIYLILAAVVIAFVLLKYIQKIQAENRNRMISDARARAVRILQRREMRARGTAFREMTQQEKEERRMLVLMSVIHRKVIQKDSKKDEMENESSLGTILKSVLQMTSSQQEDIEKNESNEEDRFPNKQDIVVSDESNTKLPEKAKEEYDSKHSLCPLCRNDFVYENGDEEIPTMENNHEEQQVEEHFSEDRNAQNREEYNV